MTCRFKVDRPKYIAGCSFGKDSLYTVILALEHGEPLDEVLYCEVMFDDNTSGEVPEHRDFVYNRGIPFLDSCGIKTTIIRSEKTFISSFYRKIIKGQRKGKLNSWPICGKCCIQRDCKIRPIQRYTRQLDGDVIRYLGIASDEQERLMRLESGKEISLLEKYSKTEGDAWNACKKYGLLSPAYDFAPRNGCFFCPNAKEPELRHLYDHHQNLWERLLECQAAPNKSTEYFNRQFRFDEIDANFKFDDSQQKWF